MPATLNRNANASQRLSQLIQLKRSERPDAEFWQTFEQEFRSRQISSFVRVQPLSTRLRRACLIAARKAAPPVTAVGAIALTFFAVNNASYLVDSSTKTTGVASVPTKQTTEADETVSLFVMNEELPEVRANQATIPSDTIYQINTLSAAPGIPGDYQLNATPVTFSHGAQFQSIGAQVIRTQQSF